MSNETDIKTLRSAYDAFGRGDLDAVAAAFSPDIVWQEAGRSPVSGTYKGRDAVFGLFGRLFELSEGTFKVELHDVTASDDHLVGLAKLSGTRGGKSLTWNEAHIWHFKNGVAVEFWNAPVEAAEVDEFWS